MCDLSGEETAAVWSVLHPKARKEHRCDCCRGRIRPGERYMKVSAVYDGSASTEKACPRCRLALERFGKEHRYTPSPSSFEEYLAECVLWTKESRVKWAPTLRALKARSVEARS
jgi:hypothetical protein